MFQSLVERVNFAIRIQFANPSCDELGVLGAKVEYENFFFHDVKKQAAKLRKRCQKIAQIDLGACVNSTFVLKILPRAMGPNVLSLLFASPFPIFLLKTHLPEGHL